MDSLLDAVAKGVPLLADLHRADVLLYEVGRSGEVTVIAQGQPHSVPPIHPRLFIGRSTPVREQRALQRVIESGKAAHAPRRLLAHRANIVQRAFPVVEASRVVGVLSLEKSLVEHVRHRTRRTPFQVALKDLRDMVLRGETEGLEALSPFREPDGLMLVNAKGRILYVSGLGSYYYRLLGYSEELVSKDVMHLETADESLIRRALGTGLPFEDERPEADRIWQRKVIPLIGPRWRPPSVGIMLLPYGFGPRDRRTVLVTIHDATSARRKARELAVRQAIVQEIHHRVKNNLQTLASLMRIQLRRAEHEETRHVLNENINRILSYAVVHEFLSQHEGQTINLRDVAGRILSQVQTGALDPTKEIVFRVEGPQIYLPAHQTTICALIMNELLLNALEHGFCHRDRGEIAIILQDEGDRVILQVNDNGTGLPENFNLDETGSLGLRIVRTVVQQDLRGTFDLQNHHGVSAVVSFPKAPPETFG
ncbi:MAG: histidine kinase N-terminal domain-containing protein [Ardenticatenaceae bacterium]|nr:histidine kinase N-terminal domain-containing protein [Ardenticatenaceae bacterium]